MLKLSEVGIVGKNTKTNIIFYNEISKDFMNDSDLPSSMDAGENVKKCWKMYKDVHPKASNSLNGSMFEAIIKSELYRQGVLPFFKEANIAFVPNVNYDIVYFCAPRDDTVNDPDEIELFENGTYFPIVLSLKASERERYKQADMEALVLKNVHRKAENYLITLSGSEYETCKEKIKRGDVLALTDVIAADTKEFDQLIKRLQSYKLGKPRPVEIVGSQKMIKKRV